MKQVVWPMRAFSFLFALVVLLAAAPAAQGQSLSPNLLSFPNTAVTNNSAAKPATLTNNGNAAMSVSVSMIGGDFDQTNNCGTSLASKKSCTINIVFNPTGTGIRAAILNVRAGSNFQLALLTGTAIPQVTLSATSMTFASQIVGVSSPASAISFKNNQNIALPMQSVTTTGDFTQTNNCGTSLAAGATCSISVVFKPTAAGTRTGVLAIRDSAVGSPQNVALTGTATASTVRSIAVSPATASIGKSKTQQFTAVVTYTNNTTADVTATATWASSNAAVATVTKGLATGVAVGSATMTASVTGSTVTGTAALTVTAPTLVSIAVTPNPVSVVKGKTQQFAATGTYSDGTTQALTSVTWSSTTGATITTTGLATASAVGTPAIKATSGTISGSAVMTVTPATLDSIAVTPATATIAKGKTQQFTATGTYTDATTQNLTATATWTSAAGATVTTGGLATGTAVGSPVITAASGAISGHATLTVQAAALVSIAVTPATATIPKGKTQQFTATGTYTDGTTLALTATWTSGTGASVTTGGLATGTAVGTPSITATSGTITGSAVLTVQPAALVSIAVTPATAVIAKGKTQQFATTGTYTDGTTLALSSVTWASGTGASITSGGLATATAVGAPAITATSGTIVGTATLTVQPAALVSIAVTPATAIINKGLTQQYAATGTYTDGTTLPLTTATWSSTTGASVASTGLATGTAVGNSTITATNGAITGSAALTVNPAALVSIAVTPASASVAKGLTQQYAATGTYTDATTQNLTGTVVWTSTAEASIVPGGMATAMTVGTPTITASSGAISGAAVLTVQPAALVSLAVSPSAASIGRGSTQQFTALGTYTDASTLDITNTVAWSATAGATMAPTGVATATTTGNTTVTAAFNSITGTASLSVVPPALTAITVTPGSVSLGLHGQQQFTAIGTFADSTTQDLTTTVVWNSGNSSLLSVNPTGFAKVFGTSSSAIPVTASSGSIVSNPAWVSAIAELPPFCSSPTIDMKLLVITNGKTEADFAAIKQTLDYLGTPYDVLDMTVTTGGITPAMLSDGNCHGYYQGIIFTFGNWMYILPGYGDMMTYEQTYHVRQLNWFVYPGTDFGLNTYHDQVASNATYSANFTPAAGPVFSYANTATPLAFSNAFIYLSTPVDGSVIPASASVTPLLTDTAGNALSVIYNPGDGREYLSQTFDSNQYLKHNLVVAYGLINWVTKGVFLGEYHIYAAGQVDDFFINDAEWVPGTPCSNPTTHDRTVSDDPSLPTFRVKLADMTALAAWQNGLQNDPLLKGFKLTMAFNGVGTTGNNAWTGLPLPGVANDDLVTGLSTYEQYFHWITHTFDHPGTLNGLHKSDVGGDTDNPQVDSIDLEILTNLYVASGTTQGGVNLNTDPASVVTPLHFTDFNPANMVSPGVTGLNDAVVPTYLYADGIRYVVSDTSVIGQTNNGPNPSPNVGIVNSYAPGIYEVPRYPNSIYYNAATWQDDEAEFHCIYGPDPGPAQPPYDSYGAAQILDYTSDAFVNNMLKGDIDPQMFHQPNLHAYDGSNSLISDVYNQTFAKYEALFKLPVLSLTLDQLGESMKARHNYNLSGVTASLTNAGSVDASVSITVPAGTVTSATIPVTGLSSNGSEIYGGQNISHINVNAGDTVALPLQ